MADIYETIVEKIVQEQEHIIGPLAIDQARKVPGLVFDTDTFKFKFSDDKKTVVEHLVKQYANLFGNTSIEVCKSAVKKLNVPHEQLPSVLQ